MMAHYGQQDNPKKLGKFAFRSICFLVFLVLLGICYEIFLSREGTDKQRKPFVLNRSAEVEVRRGSILDRFGRPLAVSLVDSSVYVKPREFSDIPETTEKLAGQLGLNTEDLLTELKTQKSFIWLARHIPHVRARKIADLHLSGVYIVNKVKRVYPHNFKVPGIIGEASQEEGLSALEYYYNDLLLGRNTEGGQPRNLFLTLDLKTQTLLEKKMSILLKEVRSAENGSDKQTALRAIVMDPETGGIIACTQQSSGPKGSISPLSLGQQSSEFFSDYIDPGGFEELFRQAALLKVSQGDMTDNATDDLRVIRTLGIKKDINPPPSPAWKKLEDDGNLVNPCFASLINKMKLSRKSRETESSLSDLEVAAFSAGLGFSSPVPLDLPRQEFLESKFEESRTFLVDKEARVLPLNLLTGFSCLVSGEYHQPHFLRAVVSDSGKVEKYQKKETGHGICKGIVEELLARMNRTAGSGIFVSVIESLQPVKDCQAEDSRDLECINGVILALTRGGQQTGSGPGLVMLLTIDNGVVDLYKTSPFKPVITDFLLQGLKNLNQQKELSSGKITEKKDRYLDCWLLTGNKEIPDIKIQNGEDGKTMPDLRGMSLRQALRRLQHRGLKIFVHGSGIVVKQSPGPGEKFKGAECVLTAEFNKMARKNKR